MADICMIAKQTEEDAVQTLLWEHTPSSPLCLIAVKKWFQKTFLKSDDGRESATSGTTIVDTQLKDVVQIFSSGKIVHIFNYGSGKAATIAGAMYMNAVIIIVLGDSAR